MEFKKQKSLKNSTSASSVTTPAIEVESAARIKPHGSELNQQIADLLFDLQNDKDEDSSLRSAPARVKSHTQNLLSAKQTENSKFLGIIGKCTIPGCDVHTLTIAGEIIEHIPTGASIDPAFSRARDFLSSQPSSSVGVLVYSSHFELLQLDGSVKQVKL